MSILIGLGSIEEALTVEAGIPEFGAARTEAQYHARLGDKSSLILIAKDDGCPVGYKVGYELEETIFYSWLGGILPDYRRFGLAQQLLEMQERWVHEQGYGQIQVKSMNRYPGMLILLLKNGYQIIDLDLPPDVEKPNPDVTKILFQKTL